LFNSAMRLEHTAKDKEQRNSVDIVHVPVRPPALADVRVKSDVWWTRKDFQ